MSGKGQFTVQFLVLKSCIAYVQATTHFLSSSNTIRRILQSARRFVNKINFFLYISFGSLLSIPNQQTLFSKMLTQLYWRVYE